MYGRDQATDSYEEVQFAVEFADPEVDPVVRELNFSSELCLNGIPEVIQCDHCGNYITLCGSYESNSHQHEDWCRHGREE